MSRVVFIGLLLPGYYVYRQQLRQAQMSQNRFTSKELLQKLVKDQVAIDQDKQVLINNRVNDFKQKKRVVILGGTLSALIQAYVILEKNVKQQEYDQLEVVMLDENDPFETKPLKNQIDQKQSDSQVAQNVFFKDGFLTNTQYPLLFFINRCVSFFSQKKDLNRMNIPEHLPQNTEDLYDHLLVYLIQKYTQTFSLQKYTSFQSFVFTDGIEGVYTNHGFIQGQFFYGMLIDRDYFIACDSIMKSVRLLGYRLPLHSYNENSSIVRQVPDEQPCGSLIVPKVWINGLYDGRESHYGFPIANEIYTALTLKEEQSSFTHDMHRFWLI